MILQKATCNSKKDLTLAPQTYKALSRLLRADWTGHRIQPTYSRWLDTTDSSIVIHPTRLWLDVPNMISQQKKPMNIPLPRDILTMVDFITIDNHR